MSLTDRGGGADTGGADTDGPDIDTAGLAAALREAVGGEVRFSDSDRHLYATDASNFRQVPLGVVLPRSVDDVLATHALCRDFGAPVTNRGGGTSLAGQCINVAVILDTSKYLDGIEAIDPGRRLVTCEPGVVLDRLRRHLPEHLTWGPDPATHNRCTVGGMIGNDACGMHAFAYGPTRDNVRELDVLLYDGTRLTVGPTPEAELEAVIRAGGRRGRIYGRLRDLRDRHAEAIRSRYPAVPRRISGFNLPQLLPENGFDMARALVGTEGTCVTVLGATLELNERPPGRRLVALGYPDVHAAADHVPTIRRAMGAIALEGLDAELLRRAGQRRHHRRAPLPEGGGWLLVELGGDSSAQARAHAERLLAGVDGPGRWPTTRLYEDPADASAVWRARESALGTAALHDGRHSWPGWEDSAVHPDELGGYLRDLRSLLDDHGRRASFYGHFGEGCVHCRIDFDLTSGRGVADYRGFLSEAAELVTAYGGSYSGEHGDGQQRGALLERMYGSELVGAFREFKAVWDPENGMNPGKVVDAPDVDSDLRLGAGFRLPLEVETKFAYPHDDGSFAAAQLRCVGVGRCRRDDGAGTMCPSYMVTHEERHSTRGRARLLFEMLRPDSDLDGWGDESVREALDLCLSCKGCVSDCPVEVDIPTYKAEFLHHHYGRRARPRVHLAMGLIDVWCRLARLAPGLVNLALRTPGLGRLFKRAAGVTPHRPLPRLAARSLRRWFATRTPPDPHAPPVLLFPDTFTNHFHPEVGRAAVRVLEDAGHRVVLPPGPLCCGRPLYDYGLLDRAGRYLDALVGRLAPFVDEDVPIVGLEPSCVAVLRDELVQMRPADPRARRVAAATHTLGGFLAATGCELPRLERRALVHGHCHDRAVTGLEGLAATLDGLGLDWEELDAGCCGLAGSFGFEPGERYEVSVAAGERRLLPAVREAAPGTLLVADGFSCRTQIEHLQRLNGTGEVGERRALHLAEVIDLARRGAPPGPDAGGAPIERILTGVDGPAWTGRDTLAVTGLLAAAVGLLGSWLRRRGRA